MPSSGLGEHVRWTYQACMPELSFFGTELHEAGTLDGWRTLGIDEAVASIWDDLVRISSTPFSSLD